MVSRFISKKQYTVIKNMQDQSASSSKSAAIAEVVISDDDDKPICRICQDDELQEELASPCYCRGTIGYMHISCLEKWLEQTDRKSCEFCKYIYTSHRTLRYNLGQSLCKWFCKTNTRNGLDNFQIRSLRGDVICFLIFTPMLFIGGYFFLTTCDYFSQEYHTPIARWCNVVLLLLWCIIGLSYYYWLYSSIQYHFWMWFFWWQRNVTVRVISRPPEENGARKLSQNFLQGKLLNVIQTRSSPSQSSSKGTSVNGREEVDAKGQSDYPSTHIRPASCVLRPLSSNRLEKTSRGATKSSLFRSSIHFSIDVEGEVHPNIKGRNTTASRNHLSMEDKQNNLKQGRRLKNNESQVLSSTKTAKMSPNITKARPSSSSGRRVQCAKSNNTEQSLPPRHSNEVSSNMTEKFITKNQKHAWMENISTRSADTKRQNPPTKPEWRANSIARVVRRSSSTRSCISPSTTQTAASTLSHSNLTQVQRTDTSSTVKQTRTYTVQQSGISKVRRDASQVHQAQEPTNKANSTQQNAKISTANSNCFTKAETYTLEKGKHYSFGNRTKKASSTNQQPSTNQSRLNRERAYIMQREKPESSNTTGVDSSSQSTNLSATQNQKNRDNSGHVLKREQTYIIRQKTELPGSVV